MIIFGSRRTSALLAALFFPCAFCRAPVAERLFRTRTWFTLFFLPIVPMGHGTYTVHCSYCGAGSAITRDNADRFLADAHAAAQMAAGLPGPRALH